MLEQNLNQKVNDVKQQNLGVIKLISFGELFTETFKTFFKGFWRLLLIHIVIISIPFIGAVVAGLITWLLAGGETLFVSIIAPIVFLVISFFIIFWGQAVIIKYLESLMYSENKIPFKKSRGYVLGLFVLGILFNLMVVFGYLFFLIPGVILMLTYLLTPYIYCLEEKRIFKAFALSKKYSKGFRFALFARILFFFIISLIVSISAQAIIFLIFLLMAPLTMGLGMGFEFMMADFFMGNFSIILVLFFLLILLIAIIFTVINNSIQVIFFYHVFDSLRSIKKKAWSENRVVSDGYGLGKKILVMLPFAIILISLVFFIITAINKQQEKSIYMKDDIFSGKNDLFPDELFPADLDNNIILENEPVDEPVDEPTTETIIYNLRHDEIFNMINEPGLDSDGDGITDSVEKILGLDLNNPDSDGDGYFDKIEIINGFDPLGPGELILDSELCTKLASTSANGRVIYPVDRKYRHLEFLGQIFTADDCGNDRLSQIEGVNNGIYILGSNIELNNFPSAEITRVLKDIGYNCQENVSDEIFCWNWQLNQDVFVEELVDLKLYANEIEKDGCVNCR